jgi:hypothetical protein
MGSQVLLHDMLWWPVNTDILAKFTARSFSIQQSGLCNIDEDLNVQFMENRHCLWCS